MKTSGKFFKKAFLHTIYVRVYCAYLHNGVEGLVYDIVTSQKLDLFSIQSHRHILL